MKDPLAAIVGLAFAVGLLGAAAGTAAGVAYLVFKAIV
jgi:hypothetical protein